MYNAQKVKDRIEIRRNEKKVSNLETMLKELGIGKSTVYAMTDNKGICCFALAKIADRLECSVDYLLGRSDKPDMTITVNQTGEIIEASPINAINNAGQPLSEMTAELVKMFEAMDFSNKMKVMNFVIDLKGNKKGADRP